MASVQTAFLSEFARQADVALGRPLQWLGGQSAVNTAGLPVNATLRREGVLQKNEVFELGDLRADLGNCLLLVEFDSRQVLMSNLVKYWPFICSALSVPPPQKPIILCHFSDWWSYGSHRDLWHWLACRMENDQSSRVNFLAKQFDHGGSDEGRRQRAISAALRWIQEAGDLPVPQP